MKPYYEHAGITIYHGDCRPIELMNWCIAQLPKCRLVLDPFGGSGTTALVARANGCKAQLIELNAEYIRIAAKRLSQEVLNFTDSPA